MSDLLVYPKPDQDVVVQAPKGYTLSTVSQDAATTRVRFRPVAEPVPDPEPVPVPPVGGLWFEYGGPWPSDTVPAYTGKGSLAAWLKAIPANGVGTLDYEGPHVENVSVALKDGVKVYAMVGKRPWLVGDFRVSGGKAQVYGLNIEYPSSPASDHVLDTSAGSLDFGHAEVRNAHCYTLIHPTGSVTDWRFHHLWVHDNYGSTSHTDVQDHGFYCSAPVAAQHGRIDHCLIEGMERGRNIKVGSAGGGPTIGGITIDHCTLRTGWGPCNLQFSNGAGDNTVLSCVFIDAGDSDTAIREGSGAHSGNSYAGNWADRKVGPNSANVKDTGGNVVKSKAELLDYAANGAAGKGHLAA